MADILYPIQELGSTDVLRYAVRNVRGVEPHTASPSDRSGFNEEAEFTARVDRALRTEHTAGGIHTGWKFPCANLIINWDGSSYSVDNESEDRGVRHGDTSIATLTPGVAGEVTITLTTALPSATINVAGIYTARPRLGATTHTIVKTVLRSVTSTTVFKVWRWQGTAITSLALTDGAFNIAVWSK